MRWLTRFPSAPPACSKPSNIWFPSITTSHDSASRGGQVAIFRPPSLSAIAHSFVCTGQRFTLRASPAVRQQACIFNFTKTYFSQIYLCQSSSHQLPRRELSHPGFHIYLVKKRKPRYVWLQTNPEIVPFLSLPALPWGASAFGPSGEQSAWKAGTILETKKSRHAFCARVCSSLSLNHIRPPFFHLVTWRQRPLHWTGEGW